MAIINFTSSAVFLTTFIMTLTRNDFWSTDVMYERLEFVETDEEINTGDP
jgi:hypothetical protein